MNKHLSSDSRITVTLRLRCRFEEFCTNEDACGEGGLRRHLYEQYEERNRYRSQQCGRWKRVEFELDDDGHPDQDNRVHTDWLANEISGHP